jgi:hypothetical protein
MMKKLAPTVLIAIVVATVGMHTASAGTASAVGADGVGDPYFPQDGNGGYRVSHYDVAVSIDPARPDQFTGDTLVRATATQDLDRFDLDLKGFQVTAVTVNGTPAAAAPVPGRERLLARLRETRPELVHTGPDRLLPSLGPRHNRSRGQVPLSRLPGLMNRTG